MSIRNTGDVNPKRKIINSTYESFAAVWPTRSGDPMSDQINAMRKCVVSGTLTDPEWANTTVIEGDPISEIRRLKETDGKDTVQYGFGQLSFALLDTRTLDNGVVIHSYRTQRPDKGVTS